MDLRPLPRGPRHRTRLCPHHRQSLPPPPPRPPPRPLPRPPPRLRGPRPPHDPQRGR